MKRQQDYRWCDGNTNLMNNRKIILKECKNAEETNLKWIASYFKSSLTSNSVYNSLAPLAKRSTKSYWPGVLPPFTENHSENTPFDSENLFLFLSLGINSESPTTPTTQGGKQTWPWQSSKYYPHSLLLKFHDRTVTVSFNAIMRLLWSIGFLKLLQR